MDKLLLNKAVKYLRKNDKVMAKLIESYEPISPRKPSQPYYHALVIAIMNQQLSVKAAKTIEKRLHAQHGGRYFNAEKILTLKPTTMRECGLSGNKVHYIRTLAQAISDDELNFRKLVRKTDDEIRNELIQYPGIGPWSVDMFMMFSLHRLDVFPIGDLAIRKSMQKHYRLTDDIKHDEYISMAEVWRPYRTIASLYLWKSCD